MTCLHDNRSVVVVSDVTIKMTHCTAHTAAFLQMLLFNNVDDNSISRMIASVKCFMHAVV
jgi:hypothetical protein